MKSGKGFVLLEPMLLLMLSFPLLLIGCRSAGGWLLKGQADLHAGRVDNAIEALTQAIQSDSVLRPKAYSQLGQAYEANEDYESAVEVYRKAIGFEYEVYDNSVYLANVLLLLNRSNEAEPILNRIAELWPKSAHLQVLSARFDAQRGKYSQAEQRLDSLLKSYPDFEEAIVARVWLCTRVQKYREAEKIIFSTKLDTDALLQAARDLARAFEGEGKLADADSICSRLIRMKPSYLDAHIEMARIYMALGREERVVKFMPSLENAQRKHLKAYLDLSRQLDQKGKMAEAEMVLTRLAKARPGYYASSTELMKMHTRHGNLGKALEVLRLVVSDSYDSWYGVPDPEWNYVAAKVSWLTRDYLTSREYSARALDQYKDVAKNNSSVPMLYARMGLCNLLIEELGTAEEDFQKFVNRTSPRERSEAVSELEDLIAHQIALSDAKFILGKYFSGSVTERKGGEPILRQAAPLVRDTLAPTIVIQEPTDARGPKMIETEKYEVRVSGLAADENGVGVVYVNGIVAALSTPTSTEISKFGLSGKAVKFAADAMLSVGDNSVDVRAVDVNGNQAQVLFKVRRVTPEPLAKKEERSVEPKLKLPQLWAVIVGISEYQNKELQLSFAHKDAQALYSFLKSANGGAIPDDRIELLTNRNATRADIIRALNEKLRMAFEDDMVIIFIASHGVPEDVSGELYFLGYDTDAKNIAGTAISQLDVEKAISTARAKRIVLIADACHSGSVGLSSDVARRSSVASYVNRLLKEIAAAREGVAILTASSSNEFSQEGARWGGHGVFTYHLLNGLKGEADTDSDGYVTIRELYEYVYRKVAGDTEGKQHPALQGKFDNNLPLSVVK
jgi:tetratricopeptide (TPR) repeat protein